VRARRSFSEFEGLSWSRLPLPLVPASELNGKEGAQTLTRPRDLLWPGRQNLVLELVLISADLSALGGTEAGSKPRFSPQVDLS
jgi:hypothetical protein